MTQRLNDTIITQLLHEPESTVELLDMIYVSDEHLSIRRFFKESKFEYLTPDGTNLKHKEHLERIKSLVIRPHGKM